MSFLFVISLLYRLNYGATLCNVEVTNDNGTSAKFNLGPYVLDEFSITNDDYWCVKDSFADTDSGRNYSYCFNLCSPVLDYPRNEDWLTNMSYCSPDTINANGYCPDGVSWEECHSNITVRTPIEGKAWAYQIRNNARLRDDKRDCWILSDERGGSPPIWSFYDTNDPSAGVMINYKNGEYSQGCNGNRELILIFKCSNDRFMIPRSEAVTEIIDDISDSDKCGKYVIEIESIYGCPDVCSSTNSICSGKGLCGYDWGINAPKCFCFWEYGGDQCDGFSDVVFSPSQKEKPDVTADLVYEFEPTYVGREDNGNVFETDIELVYNLRPFGVDSGDHYLVRDTAAYGRWVFYIGIGTPIDTQYLPDACEFVSSPCYDYDYINEQCNHEIGLYNDTAYVLQYSNRTDTGDCQLLGSALGSTTLINSIDDFAKGITMTYIGGAYADGCQTPDKNRIFHINFACPNSNSYYNWDKTYDYDTHEIEFTTLVTEDTPCEYEITIDNALACPYQCITGDPNYPDDFTRFAVCSGHGKCAADPYVGYVRCICDTGYTGNECETSYSISPTISPTTTTTLEPTPKGTDDTSNITENNTKCTVLLIIVIVLAVIICIGTILGCWKYRRDVIGTGSYSLGPTGDGAGHDTEIGRFT